MDEKLTRIYVCEADLKEGEMRGIKVENQWLLIVHYQNRYYALDAACAHSGFPLFKGTLDADGVITCGLHYAKFQCQTGAVVSDPPICENQKTFKTEIKSGKVYWIKNQSSPPDQVRGRL